MKETGEGGSERDGRGREWKRREREGVKETGEGGSGRDGKGEGEGEGGGGVIDYRRNDFKTKF